MEIKMLNFIVLESNGMDRDHNSLYDRGAADSYYGRKIEPHYYIKSTRITDLTQEQIDEYCLGYSENIDFKDWG
jgi:hypothetical protein